VADLAEGLRTFLLADATVAALVGTRMSPQPLPQGSALPALTYTLVNYEQPVSHNGTSGLEHHTIQIDCWGADTGAAVALFTAVRKRLRGYTGLVGTVRAQGIFLAQARDLYDDETKAHRRIADFSVWNEESD
jgi:hypothetical protein